MGTLIDLNNLYRKIENLIHKDSGSLRTLQDMIREAQILSVAFLKEYDKEPDKYEDRKETIIRNFDNTYLDSKMYYEYSGKDQKETRFYEIKGALLSDIDEVRNHVGAYRGKDPNGL